MTQIHTQLVDMDNFNQPLPAYFSRTKKLSICDEIDIQERNTDMNTIDDTLLIDMPLPTNSIKLIPSTYSYGMQLENEYEIG